MGAGIAPRALGGQHSKVRDLEGHELDLDLGDARREKRVLDEGTSAFALGRGHMLEEPEVPLRGADGREVGAFVAEKKLGAGPPLVFLADEILGRHPNVVEPDLIDLVGPVERDDRAHRDPGRRHFDEQK